MCPSLDSLSLSVSLSLSLILLLLLRSVVGCCNSGRHPTTPSSLLLLLLILVVVVVVVVFVAVAIFSWILHVLHNTTIVSPVNR